MGSGLGSRIEGFLRVGVGLGLQGLGPSFRASDIGVDPVCDAYRGILKPLQPKSLNPQNPCHEHERELLRLATGSPMSILAVPFVKANDVRSLQSEASSSAVLACSTVMPQPASGSRPLTPSADGIVQTMASRANSN